MAGDAYTFTGLVTTGFFAYRDLDTDKMLVAEPGQSYRIGATEAGQAIPPDPSLWELTPPAPAPAKAAKTASNGTQGGE